jgi:hypothetical protein
MEQAFGRAVDAATSTLRRLHRAVHQPCVLGAARRALAGNDTKQRAPCKRSRSKCRFA